MPKNTCAFWGPVLGVTLLFAGCGGNTNPPPGNYGLAARDTSYLSGDWASAPVKSEFAIVEYRRGDQATSDRRLAYSCGYRYRFSAKKDTLTVEHRCVDQSEGITPSQPEAVGSITVPIAIQGDELRIAKAAQAKCELSYPLLGRDPHRVDCGIAVKEGAVPFTTNAAKKTLSLELPAGASHLLTRP